MTSSVVSSDNLSAVPKGPFSTKTSTAALTVPQTHPDEHSLDSVMRQAQVENASEEKNVLENSSDKSQITGAELSWTKKRKGKKKRVKGHDAIESNRNLSTVTKGGFSTETSTATFAVPPTHPDEHSLDSVMRQAQVENASGEKNVLENSSDKSEITGAKLSLTKKRKGKKKRVKGHDAIESNNNLSAVAKGGFSTEPSTATFAVPPTHPNEHSLDSVMRQAQVENESKEKDVLENSSNKSQIMAGAELSLTKKRKRNKGSVKGHGAIESNNNISVVLKDSFSTKTSTAALAEPPTNPDEPSLDSLMRQSQVENASKEKKAIENSSDKSQITTGAELSSTTKRKRKKRRVKGHDASESNHNLSAVPKDAFSTETSTTALTVPQTHPDEHSLDSVMRQAQVENASGEKNVLENSSDKSEITGAELSWTKKRKGKKKRVKGHDAIESNHNLSTVTKGGFSTETSTATFAVPPTHPDEHSLDSVMRQAQVENASGEKNVLENSSDKSEITGAELSLTKKRKGKKKRVKGHDAIERNYNLSTVAKGGFSTETSTATFAVPPTHPDEHSLDSVMRQAQVENASGEKNVLENSSDKSEITGAELSWTKKRKGKKKRVKGHDAIESNYNLSTVAKGGFSTETSTATFAVPPTHPDEHSLDSVMRQAQVENASGEKNVLENSSDKSEITGAELSWTKKRKGKKKRVKGHDAIESNRNLSTVTKGGFSTETSTATFAVPPTHPDEHSLDSVMRQAQVENASEEKNVLENSSDKSEITGAELSLTKKRKRKKGRVKGYDAIERNNNISVVPKDSFSTETSTVALSVTPAHPGEHSLDSVMRQSQVKNALNENVLHNASDKSQIMTSLEASLRNKRKWKKRQGKGHDASKSNDNLSAVPKDTLSAENSMADMDMPPTHLMSQCQEENQGKDPNMVEKATDVSPAMTSAKVNSRKKNKGRRKTKHDSLQSNVNLSNDSKGDISHSNLVRKHDHSKVSHFSLGRAISSYSEKKLLVLDLNGLLSDFVLGVPEGYKPDRMIQNKAVFKRPFCDDFLQFCFDKFHVGIWSSRKRVNVNAAIELLVGVSASKLLFVWDQGRCTLTKFKTIEDKRKPLMLKELRKLWERCRPELPWNKGEFNETNTLLLDDSPYKAIRNPMHTAIFPYSYQYSDTNDASLGPGGDLRVYLEGLAMAENVQEYVASNPFGQPPITESSPHWQFYCEVKRSRAIQRYRKRRSK